MESERRAIRRKLGIELKSGTSGCHQGSGWIWHSHIFRRTDAKVDVAFMDLHGPKSDPHRIGSKHSSKRVSRFDVNQLVWEDSQNLQEEWQQVALLVNPLHIYSYCRYCMLLQISELKQDAAHEPECSHVVKQVI